MTLAHYPLTTTTLAFDPELGAVAPTDLSLLEAPRTAVSVGRTRFTLQKIIDRAIGRCKLPSQLITAEKQEIARDNLSLVLADLSNRGTMLWTQERLLLPFIQGSPLVELPSGTVDLLPDSVNYRTAPRVGDQAGYASAEGVAAYAGDGDLNTSTTQTSTNGTISVAFTSPTPVTFWGLNPNGDHYYNLVTEVSDDGVSWVVNQRVPAPYGEVASFYPDALWAWYEAPLPAIPGSYYWRVRETSGGVLALRELYLCSQPYDIPLARVNRQQYMNLPNKLFMGGGRPTQFYLERETDPELGEICKMICWPVPGPESLFASVALMRKRYIADLQDYSRGVELPTRWYDALIWQLASYLASEYQEVPSEREAYLETRAKQEVQSAIDEERDNSPIQIQANISRYTR